MKAPLLTTIALAAPELVWASAALGEGTATQPSLGASAMKAVVMLLILAAGSLILKRVVRQRWSATLQRDVTSRSLASEIAVTSRTRIGSTVELVTVNVWGEEVLLSVSSQGAQTVLCRRDVRGDKVEGKEGRTP